VWGIFKILKGERERERDLLLNIEHRTFLYIYIYFRFCSTVIFSFCVREKINNSGKRENKLRLSDYDYVRFTVLKRWRLF
jgi:hypothetical protein